MVVPALLQKQNVKIPNNSKNRDTIRNKLNNDSRNINSFSSFNNKNSYISSYNNPSSSLFKNDDHYPRKPFHSNIH